MKTLACMHNEKIGNDIYNLIKRLFPICRSITGEGVRETLKILREYCPELEIIAVPSGTPCFDWIVPKEWNIYDAYVLDPEGKKIIDFKQNNLHIVSYSIPVNQEFSLEELQKYLYSLPDQPDAIPYVTSYYKERWGICLTHRQRESLKKGTYKVVIDSALCDGYLNYGELYIPGDSKKEVLLSTNICHPSMGNNELSGPTVTTFLARWLKTLPKRKYSYRIVYVPETIGSILYLSRHYRELKECVIAGFNVVCVGDDRTYSYLPTRWGNTLSDKVAKHVLKYLDSHYLVYSYKERGSDERQYCSPGIDLPIASVMRSKYAAYSEYHTSLDNLDFVSPKGLAGGYRALQLCLKCLEWNEIYQTQGLCEPQLSKRGLYPSVGEKDQIEKVTRILDLLAYSDGQHDLLDIAEKMAAPLWELELLVNSLVKHDLLQSLPRID